MMGPPLTTRSGAGTGGATKQILKRIGTEGFATYTYTDISTGFFEEAASVFAPYRRQMTFKALDASRDPVSQGFAPGAYDLIAAWFVIHATPKLEVTLRNLRRLLRPGGFLVVGEWTSQDWTHDGFIFGTLPGWWAGVEEGRTISPCVASEHWDEVLRNSGFSGIDTITPEAYHDTHAATVFVSQAVDDTVTFLREPLSAPLPSSSLASGHRRHQPLQDLVIVGGSSLRTVRLVSELKGILGRYAESVITVKTLSGLPLDLSPDTTVVSLSELDAPIFEHLTAANLDALKQLVSSERTLLWVTRGRRTGEPFPNMSIAFLRTAAREVPGLRLQCIDFEGSAKIDARLLSEAVMRFHYLSTSASTVRDGRKPSSVDAGLLWSVEPEIIIDAGGRQLIPRFVPFADANDRYNSARRIVTHDVAAAERALSVQKTREGGYSVYDISSLPMEDREVTDGDSLVELHASHAILSPVNTPLGPRFVTLGHSSSHPENRLLALTENLNSITTVHDAAIVSDTAADSTVLDERVLVLTAVNLFAQAILEPALRGQALAVHGAPEVVAAVLSRRAMEKGVSVVFTTTTGDTNATSGSATTITIPSYLPHRDIRQLLPTGLSRFVVFSARVPDEVAHIISCLPPYCRVETAFSEVSAPLASLSLPSSAHDVLLRDRLSQALRQAEKDLVQLQGVQVPIRLVQLNELVAVANDASHSWDPLSIIRWSAPGSIIPARVSRLDSRPLFKRNKTYWLVGLSRDLGLSICDWMISRGAKHIVITSRRPAVDPAWEESCRRKGAVVKIMAR